MGSDVHHPGQPRLLSQMEAQVVALTNQSTADRLFRENPRRVIEGQPLALTPDAAYEEPKKGLIRTIRAGLAGLAGGRGRHPPHLLWASRPVPPYAIATDDRHLIDVGAEELDGPEIATWFATIIARFFRSSLSVAFATTLSVSAANPTRRTSGR